MYSIIYIQKVVKEDIPRLDTKSRLLIKSAIENKLKNNPEVYGKPLRQSLAGYRKLRAGDYRVIFMISKKTVIIIIIGHGSSVYKMVSKRT